MNREPSKGGSNVKREGVTTCLLLLAISLALAIPAAGSETAIVTPGRAAVFGFPMNGTSPQLRYWLNHGEAELPELTGPNDKQLVGDFRKLGYDQVLFLNYWGGTRHVVVADFEVGGGLGVRPPALPYVESFAPSTLLDGWDDADDQALVGDFMHLGYDQVLLIDGDGPGTQDPAQVGHLMIVDYQGSSPVVRYRETWVQDSLLGWLDDGDVALAGDFRHLGYEQVLFMNQSKRATEGRFLVRDFSSGRPADLYSRSYPQDPELNTWNDEADRRYVGDFLARGYDQLLLLNMQNGLGRVRIVDLSGENEPTTGYLEKEGEFPLLNGWHDPNDWAFVGDFSGLEHDEMLFINRSGQDGRVLVADFANGSPAKVRYLEPWGDSTLLNGWQDEDDIVLAGRFTKTFTAALLAFNNDVVNRRPDKIVRVHSPQVLETRLRSHFTGRVVIPFDARWDMGSRAEIPLRTGVSLVGERGPLTSRPLLYTTNKEKEHALFRLTGNDVRVEGIHFQGPQNGNRSNTGPYVHAINLIEDPVRGLGRRVLVADNEFDEWTGGGVNVVGTHNVRKPEQYDPGWLRIEPEDAGLVRVERNYMHHNVRDGGGYGVTLSGGVYVAVVGNVFDFNRHAVAASGFAYSGYIARFNYVLEGGFKQKSYYNQHFDVHGTNTNDYGGPAGVYFEIAFNTIRGEQKYYVFKTRPAFMLRGKPAKGAYFNNNVAVHNSLDAAVSLKWTSGDSGIGEDHAKFNFNASGNRFNTDYSLEIAGGDFDGDRRTDVFVANGTAWFFSRAGIKPWEFLHASTKRTAQLGFADIDNDRITDVLYRNPNGNLGYLKSGTQDLVPLTSVPVPMKELRFEDFDGDGRTDIFYTRRGRWQIWYGSTRTWRAAQASALPISGLLFGEFDDVRGTDVAGVANGTWSYSSGGTAKWARLNAKLTRSLAGGVAADFDGNGKTDIAFNGGADWRFSPDGRSSFVSLRKDRKIYGNPPLKSMVIGQFDGDPGAEVANFNRVAVIRPRPPVVFIPGLRLVVWRGLGSGHAFGPLSAQDMR
jgi:hypothetical protein